jgi:hypothetical protein
MHRLAPVHPRTRRPAPPLPPQPSRSTTVGARGWAGASAVVAFFALGWDHLRYIKRRIWGSVFRELESAETKTVVTSAELYQGGMRANWGTGFTYNVGMGLVQPPLQRDPQGSS